MKTGLWTTLFSRVPLDRRRGFAWRTLAASMGDGVFASVMVGVMDTFFTPYALALQATSRQIAWMASFPGLLGALAQWWTGHLTRIWGSRKIVLARVVAGQASVVTLMATLPWWPRAIQIPALVALVIGYATFGGLSGPVWNSIMAEYVPSSKRASYFGWRNRITGTIVILSALAAGSVLHGIGGGSVPGSPVPGILWGFAAVLMAAAACRWISFGYIRHFYEPSVSTHNLPTGRFGDFLQQTRSGPFWRFTACMAGLTFGANLSGPYFPVYMLKGLKFSYLTYTVVMVALHLSIANTMIVWGRKADEVGLLKVLRLTVALTSVIPVLWLFSKSPLYILFLQIFGGMVWSGVNLCTTNYLFEAVPSRLRTQAIAYFNAINGASLFAGAFIGGYLLEHLPPLLGFRFLTLLQLSGLLRLAVALVLLPRVPAVRIHAAVPSWQIFFDVIGLRPVVDLARDVLQTLVRPQRE